MFSHDTSACTVTEIEAIVPFIIRVQVDTDLTSVLEALDLRVDINVLSKG